MRLLRFVDNGRDLYRATNICVHERHLNEQACCETNRQSKRASKRHAAKE